jgi:hypothetical protein
VNLCLIKLSQKNENFKKQHRKISTCNCVIRSFSFANSQGNGKPTAAVLSIDSKGVINNSESVSYMVRLELEKPILIT